VQVFDEAWAAKQPYDVLDATKLIPEEDVPVEIVGRMTLNRNVDNFFAETEQVAFLPSNVIPASISATIRCSRGACFPISTRRSRAWAPPISTRSRSTRPSARSTTCSATA
jgi:catalase